MKCIISICLALNNSYRKKTHFNLLFSALKGQSMAFAMPSAGSMKGTPTVVRPRVRLSVPTGDVAPARPPGCLSATMFQVKIILTQEQSRYLLDKYRSREAATFIQCCYFHSHKCAALASYWLHFFCTLTFKIVRCCKCTYCHRT